MYVFGYKIIQFILLINSFNCVQQVYILKNFIITSNLGYNIDIIISGCITLSNLKNL